MSALREEAALPTESEQATLPEYQPAWPAGLTPHRSPWLLSLRSNGWVLLALAALYVMAYGMERLFLPLGTLAQTIGWMVMLAAGLQLIIGFSGQVSLGHAAAFGLGAWVVGQFAAPATANQQPLDWLKGFTAMLIAAGLVFMVGFVLLRAIRLSARLHAGLPLLILVLLAGWVTVDIAASHAGIGSLWVQIAAELWAACQRGIRYLPDLPGQQHLPLPPAFISLGLSVLGGAVVAGLAGWITSSLAHRVPLAVLTLAASLTWLVLEPGDRTYALYHTEFHLPDAGLPMPSFWVLALGLVAVITVWRVARSDLGRTMMVVPKGELAAAAIGIDPARQRTRALVIGCALAGAAGVVAAHVSAVVVPKQVSLMQGLELLALIIIAGRWSISGVALTTIVLTALWSFAWHELQPWRFAFYALAMLLVLRYRPQGIFGDWEIIPSRSTLRASAGGSIP